MKPGLSLLLGLSLFGNLVLLLLPGSSASSPAAGAVRSQADPRRGSEGARALEAAEQVAVGRDLDPQSPVWASVEATDPAVMRDGLRAAGFPEEIVRAVVWARIQREFDARKLALVGGGRPEPFWDPQLHSAQMSKWEGFREIDREQREMFKNYFAEGMGDEARLRQDRERLPFLPLEKATSVARIESDYGELIGSARREMFSGIQLDEDQQKLAMLESEKRADLAAVLSPEELELYDLHTSQTANSMRSRMTYFQPTEDEFRAIFALQRSVDERFPMMMGTMPRDVATKRSEANRELKNQIASVLGPERAAEYERSTDYQYTTARKIVDHFGLPEANATAVYGMQNEYMRRVSEAARATSDPAASNAAAKALAAEAGQRLVDLLGAEGAKAYQDTAGSWVRRLAEQGQRGSAPVP